MLVNQTAFMNECKERNENVRLELINGHVINGEITSEDKFTIIVNETTTKYNQQIPFLNAMKNDKLEVTINLINSIQVKGIISAHDMYTIIVDNNKLLFKNNISSVVVNNSKVVMIFKSSIAINELQ
jgi:RNA chaperone Hfq